MDQFSNSGRDSTQIGRDYNQNFLEVNLLKRGFPKTFSNEYNLYFERWNLLNEEQQLNILFSLLNGIKKRNKKFEISSSNFIQSNIGYSLLVSLVIAIFISICLQRSISFEVSRIFLLGEISQMLISVHEHWYEYFYKQSSSTFDFTKFYVRPSTEEEARNLANFEISRVYIIANAIIYPHLMCIKNKLLTFPKKRELISLKNTARILFNLLNSNQRGLIIKSLEICEKDSKGKQICYLPEEYEFLNLG
jgi:hypothetical protein